MTLRQYTPDEIGRFEEIPNPEREEEMKAEEIGEISFFSNDLDREITIKDYLRELLCTLWQENEQFNGKRPFGNSGWDYDVYGALISGGAIKGRLDGNGYVESLSERQESIGRNLVLEYIVEYM